MEINAIVKEVAMACNLNCKYCFYSKQARRKKVMSEKVLKNLIEEICDYNLEEARFYWHGGEPLLTGIEFYKKAISLQEKIRKPGQKIFNGLVTNATLLDESWSDFFQRNNFEIGVSLDGPKEFHDRYRIFPNGKGSFEKTMEGVRNLRSQNVKFHILCVITDESVKKPNKIVSFFEKEKLEEINLIPSIAIDSITGLSYKESVSPKEYIDFLIEVFDLWLGQDNKNFKILPLESIVRAFLGLPQEDCRFAGDCGKSIVFDYNGDIFFCCTYGYKDFPKIGNISEGIRKIISSKKFLDYKEYLKSIKNKCMSCPWYGICKGGCPFYHYLGNGNNIFCHDYQRLFGHIKRKIDRIIS
jgi:uncharacterized protein